MSLSIYWLLLEKALRVLTGIFVSTAVAKHLGPGEYGSLAIAIGIAGLAIAAANMGADHLNVSELGRNEGLDFLLTLFLCRIGVALACTLALLAYAWFAPGGEQSLLTILSWCVIAAAPLVFVHKLYAVGRFGLASLLSILSILIGVVVRLTGIALGYQTDWFAWSFSIEALFAGLLPMAWVLATRWRELRALRTPTGPFSQYLRLCAPITLAAVLVALQFRLELFIVGAVLSPEAAGTWAAAMMFILPWNMASAAVLPVLNRRLTQDLRSEQGRYLRNLVRLIRWMTVAAVGAILFNVAAIHVAVPLLLGEKYARVTAVATIGSLAILPLVLGAVQELWLAHQRKTGVVLRKLLIGIPLASALVVLGASTAGLTGTAAAMVMSHVTTAVLLNLVLDRGFFRLKLAAMGLGRGTSN